LRRCDASGNSHRPGHHAANPPDAFATDDLDGLL